MKLIYYPNIILSTPCEEVINFDNILHSLLDEMKKIMLENKGLGLSANQIGNHSKVMIVYDHHTKEIHEMINPIITSTDGSVLLNEGCLSAPNIFIPITRPETCVVEFQDRHGVKHVKYAYDMTARVVMHEMEHLFGKFFLDNVNRQQRRQALSQLKKMKLI